METVYSQLRSLIDEYKAAVAAAVTLLNHKSETAHRFQLERMGYLDGTQQASYEFHGYGCFVTTKAFTVDFNFGDDGRCDGIDPWFLFDFLDSNKAVKEKYPLVISHEQIRRLLQGLENDGLAARGIDSLLYNTYYLTADVHNLNPVRWKPYPPDDDVVW